MAQSLKELAGWEIVLTDEKGNPIEADKRRSRRKNQVERVVVRRTADGLTLTRGDCIKVENAKPKYSLAGNTSLHFICDIRLNTFNNLVEIWVYEFLQWFQIDPVNYCTQILQSKPDPLRPEEIYENEMLQSIDKSEIYLVLEPSEILLKKFKGKFYLGKDYTSKYISNVDGDQLEPFNLLEHMDTIINLSFKETEEYFKRFLLAKPVPQNNNTNKRKQKQQTKKIRKPTIEEVGRIDLSGDDDDDDDDDEDTLDPSSSDEFKINETNEGEEIVTDLEDEELEIEEEEEDEEEEDEEGEDDDDDDVELVTSKRDKTVPRRKRLLPKSEKKFTVKKKKRSDTPILIKKFTKKNVTRAKKKYTPFSKKYNSIEEIPDLNKLPGFYKDENELDDHNNTVNKLETKLDTKKKQKIVETIFSKVKKQLYSSHGKEMIVKSKDFDSMLPARENEFASIYLSIYSAMESDSATTIYIAGTPGVGKTLTIREVIKEIQNSSNIEELSPFLFVELNGLKMVKPTDSYEFLWNKISSESLTWGASMESLEFYFEKVPKNKKRTVIVLLDELDALVNKGQDIMYNIFNWTTYSNAKLIVIAVANTMDLPERQLGNKVSSRIGFTRIMFSGYTFEELKQIIDFRLKSLNNSYFYVDVKTGSAYLVDDDSTENQVPKGMKRVKLHMSNDAIEIASRKVASVSGDARRALKVCKRAAEIAEDYYMKKHGYGYDGKTINSDNDDTLNNNNDDDDDKDSNNDTDELQTVHIKHIMQALNETTNNVILEYICSLSFTTKLFLCSLLHLIRKTKQQEQTLGDIIDEIKLLIDVNGSNKFIVDVKKVLYGNNQLKMTSWSQTLNQLIDSGIIIKQNMKNERTSTIKLNVSHEDVKSALMKDEILKDI